jgi:hypothetical protein
MGGRRSSQVRTRRLEDFSQNIVLLAYLDELLPNDLAEPLGPRRQTTEAIVHRGYRGDAIAATSRLHIGEYPRCSQNRAVRISSLKTYVLYVL